MSKDWRTDGPEAVIEEAKQQQEKHNFRSVIPWRKLEKHFKKLERKVVAQLRRVKDDADFRFYQGQLDLLDKLMDLPEALTLVEEDDPNARTHKEGKS